MNQFILVGKVQEKPTMNETANGIKFSSFVINSKRDYKNSDGTYDSDLYKITLWKDLAENTKDLLKKGALVGVKGRINANNLEKEDGTTYYNSDLVGERVSVLEKN